MRRDSGYWFAVMRLVTAAILVCLLLPAGAQQEDEDGGKYLHIIYTYNSSCSNIADFNERALNWVREKPRRFRGPDQYGQ